MTQPPEDRTPHEGEEGVPTDEVPPPVRYQPDAAAPAPAPRPADTPAPAPSSAPVPARSGSVPVGKRLAAVSGPLSFILFMVCGFALDGWAWSWIFFLLPGLIYTWNAVDHHDD